MQNNKSNKRKNTTDINTICKKFNDKSISYSGNAFIYCRVSTSSQVDGLSLETQLQTCREYCDINNYNILQECKEIISARSIINQTKLNYIINNNNHFNLIVLEPTRLSRNLKDFINFVDLCKGKSITIHFAEDRLISSNDDDFIRIVQNVYKGEMESKTLGIRVKRSVVYRKKNNTFISGRAKFGYKIIREIIDDKIKRTIIPEPTEQKIIKLINLFWKGSSIKDIEKLLFEISGEKHEIYDIKNESLKINFVYQGNMKYIDIARFLNSCIIRNRGKIWTSASISKLIN